MGDMLMKNELLTSLAIVLVDYTKRINSLHLSLDDSDLLSAIMQSLHERIGEVIQLHADDLVNEHEIRDSLEY